MIANLAQLQQLQHYLQQGVTLSQLQEIPQHELDQLYHYAYHCYQQRAYRGAKNSFYLLTQLHQWRFEYHLGLGLCCQHLDEHLEALDHFSRSALVKMDDPRPPYYCSLSYYSLKRWDKAHQACIAAFNWCSSHPEMSCLKQAIERQLAAITLRRSS